MVFFHSRILFLTLIAATSGYIAVREDRAVSTSSDEEDSGSGVGHQGELVSLTGEPAAHPPPRFSHLPLVAKQNADCAMRRATPDTSVYIRTLYRRATEII